MKHRSTNIARLGCLAFGTFLFVAACSQVPTVNPGEYCQSTLSAEKSEEPVPFPYDLSAPKRTLTLDPELKEISGLSMSADGKHLAAVQDEWGILYFLSLEDGKIVRRVDFGKKGDYEGLVAVGSAYYVVRSSGVISELHLKESVVSEVQVHKNFLHAGNDVEGLGYDVDGNRLLLACKGMGGQAGQFPGVKTVYAFDLDARALDSIPALCIPKDTLLAFVDRSINEEEQEAMYKALGKTKDGFGFNPSGIAVHPRSGHWYMTSANERFLLVIDPQNSRIVHFERLKNKLLEQAEGICFDRKGTLYIASEGKEKNPVIQVYPMKK